jgi:hypothetical protein
MLFLPVLPELFACEIRMPLHVGDHLRQASIGVAAGGMGSAQEASCHSQGASEQTHSWII